MEDFELLRHITIGQYLPGDSIIHRLDPRTKLSIFLFITAAVTFSISYTGNIILVLVTLSLVLLSGVSMRYVFSGIKPAIPIIIVLAILQLLFYGGQFVPYGMQTKTYFHWGWIHISNGSVQLVIVSAMRFVELLFLTSLLTNTTTQRPDHLQAPAEITDQQGGLSGKPLYPISIELVRWFAERLDGKIPIIAVGGISTRDQVRAMLDAGASLVEIYTGFVYGGPGTVKRLL